MAGSAEANWIHADLAWGPMRCPNGNVMPYPKFSDEACLDALLLFARTHLVAGGSLRAKAYTGWADAPMSATAILNRFGDGSWPAAVFRFQEEMFAQAKDLDAVAAELPVRCRGNYGVSWVPGRVGDWLTQGCPCTACRAQPLPTAYPELVERLQDPADAEKGSTVWFEWACPERRRGHRPFRASVELMAAGGVYCAACRRADKFYRQHPVGTLKTNPEVARSKVEAPVVDALRALLPGERFATRQSVVIGAELARNVGSTITPDIVMVRRKLAIEIDGGDGNSPRYSTHDTVEGANLDVQRDLAIASLGWTSIRLRHPNALPLPGSPATIVTTASKSPKVMASALASAIEQVIAAM